MKHIIGLLIVALLMFSAAAGASWWWQQQHAPPSTSATPADHPPPAAANREVPHTAAAPQAAASTLPPPDPHQLPVTVRPRPMSVEELLRYGLSLNARDETLIAREEEFRRREVQLKLALADLQGEQSQIDGLRTQVQQQLEAADKLLARIRASRQELAQAQADAKAQLEQHQSLQTELDADELANIKRLATWVRAMDPAKAGEVLREMANDGRADTAVRILSHLEEREAARVLDSLGDSALVDDLIQQYQRLRSSKSASRPRTTR